MKPMVRIHNLETNEIVDREMTDEEYIKYQEAQATQEAEEAAIAEKIASDNAARATLLDKLGITADEAALLGL